IGLQTLLPQAWLEGGDAEAARKSDLITRHPTQVWGELEGSRPGQEEVLALVQTARGQAADPVLPPLWAASLLCADDLCLMELRAGAWTLTAASLTSPTFFTVEEALGKNLDQLH